MLGSINSQPVLAQGTLKVTNIPSFVTQDDFGRLFAQMEGCISATLMGRQPTGDQIGFVEFSDKMNASKAKNLYQAWSGWGGRGLNVEFAAPAPAAQQVPGQKRVREGEDAYQQAGGNYKQQRADGSAMGMGSQLGAPGLQQDTSVLLQQVSAGMLSGLMQPGMAQQLMEQAPQQQAQQGAGGLQSAGMAAGLAGGGSTPTGQQILQQQAMGLGQAGGQQQGQPGGAALGMLGTQQQVQQGASTQAGGHTAQLVIPGIAGMGGAGQQQELQAGSYLTADNMARLASSLAGGQLGQQQGLMAQQVQQGAQQAQQQYAQQQQAQQAQQAQQQQAQQQLAQQQLAGMQAQLPAGYTLQPGTVLLQPTSAGYQQLQAGQVYQMPQQAQQMAPQQAQQTPMQPQYLQQGQPTILQPGQFQVAGTTWNVQPGQGGVISQQGLAQPAPMAPIPVQQAPPGTTIIQPQSMAVATYPPDACPTLYAEGFPEDMTKRELCHIFRPYEGFKGIRFVVKDSKKHVGEKLVMAFIEFSNTYYAAECMNALQGYPLDLDDPNSYVMRIKYARPLDNPPRGGGAGGGPGGPYGGGRGGGGRGGESGRGYGGRPDYGPYSGGGRGRGRGPPPMDDRRDRRDDRDRR